MTKLASESVFPPTVGREEWAAGLSVLHLEGPLRAPVGRDLRWRVEALLARGRRSILLDLANVTDLDAAGLGELVRVHTLAGAARGELWIRNARGRIRKLLDRAGLFYFLSVPPPVRRREVLVNPLGAFAVLIRDLEGTRWTT